MSDWNSNTPATHCWDTSKFCYRLRQKYGLTNHPRRNLHFDLADLPLPLLELTKDRELSAQLIAGLKLLRATLDVKLHELRKVKAPAFDA